MENKIYDYFDILSANTQSKIRENGVTIKYKNKEFNVFTVECLIDAGTLNAECGTFGNMYQMAFYSFVENTYDEYDKNDEEEYLALLEACSKNLKNAVCSYFLEYNLHDLIISEPEESLIKNRETITNIIKKLGNTEIGNISMDDRMIDIFCKIDDKFNLEEIFADSY